MNISLPLPPTIFTVMEYVRAIGIILSSVSFALNFAIALPSILVMIKRIKSRRIDNHDLLHKLYEDEDGIASEKSQEQYVVGFQRHIVLTITGVGNLMALGCSIYSTVHSNEVSTVQDWITFGSWVNHYCSRSKC